MPSARTSSCCTGVCVCVCACMSHMGGAASRTDFGHARPRDRRASCGSTCKAGDDCAATCEARHAAHMHASHRIAARCRGWAAEAAVSASGREAAPGPAPAPTRFDSASRFARHTNTSHNKLSNTSASECPTSRVAKALRARAALTAYAQAREGTFETGPATEQARSNAAKETCRGDSLSSGTSGEAKSMAGLQDSGPDKYRRVSHLTMASSKEEHSPEGKADIRGAVRKSLAGTILLGLRRKTIFFSRTLHRSYFILI